MFSTLKKSGAATAMGRKNLFGGYRSWITAGLLLLMLGIAVHSVEEARWVSPKLSLLLVLAIAVLVTWILSRMRLHGVVRHSLIFLAGLAVIFWQGLGLFPSTAGTSSISQLGGLLGSLWQAVLHGSAVTGTVHFALFLILLTWILGYTATWFALRRQNPWVGIFLGTIAILINLSNLPGKFYSYLFFFVLAAVFLIGWMKLLPGYLATGRMNKQGTGYFAVSFVCLILVASLLIIPIPDFNLSQTTPVINVKVFWQDNVQNHLNNLLAGVPSHLPVVSAGDQEQLLFSDYADSQKDEVQFTATTPQPYYWRTNDYSTYISSGWANRNITEIQSNNKDATTIQSQDDKQRTQINYKVTAQVKTNVILVAGDFNKSDSPVEINTVDSSGSGVDTATIASIVSIYQLNPGQHYDITASVSTASPEQLSSAGTAYPSWVTDEYLQLPSSLPTRVEQLGKRITRRSVTPYEKVLAVKQYLSDLTYQPESKAPPAGRDGVDYFLFTSKTGNCGYFASAAVVLLRAAGVPARLAVGYMSDEWNSATTTNTIRAKNAHAWPEIYFPGYGWIEVEATPGSAAASAAGTQNDTMPAQSVSGEGYTSSEYWQYLYNVPPAVNPAPVNDPQPAIPVHRNIIILLIIVISIAGIVTVFLVKEMLGAGLYGYGILQGKPDFATEIYRKMCYVSGWYGVKPQPQETPSEFKERLIKAFPRSAQAISQIVDTYAEAHFGPRRKLDYGREVEIQKAWIGFYRDIRKKMFRIRHRCG